MSPKAKGPAKPQSHGKGASMSAHGEEEEEEQRSRKKAKKSDEATDEDLADLLELEDPFGRE